MKFPDQFRSPSPTGLPHGPGDPYGWFIIPYQGKMLRVLASAAVTEADAPMALRSWDHVSVSLLARCPTWEEMCFVKDLFFEPEDTVVQFHPPRAEYVNFAPNCLHLWRHVFGFPRPSPHLVGPR